MAPLEEYEHDDEPAAAPGYRTYEVYQRERVGETTNLIKPRQLISNEYLDNPYPLLEILRENYPCYRDWLNNRFWLTRYDDVTSVFVDDRNFETRPKSWCVSMGDSAISLWKEIEVQKQYESLVDSRIHDVVSEVLDSFSGNTINLATEFCARVPLLLFAKVVGIPANNQNEFISLYWESLLAKAWDPVQKQKGMLALIQMEKLLADICDDRRNNPKEDLISAVFHNANLGRAVTAQDLLLTLFDIDQETLIGGLANLWFNLLTTETEMEKVTEDKRLLKFAWLETLRHSPPLLSAERFAKYEVERFGRLIPQGGLVMCSAAGANRDPRQFNNPNKFIVGRKDLCQREPRGQYRADGLPSGIAFSLGKPSVHPAVPKERSRSLYAIVRDSAVTASEMFLDSYSSAKLVEGSEPKLKSLYLRGIHSCWELDTEI
jgi:cytochrome P450